VAVTSVLALTALPAAAAAKNAIIGPGLSPLLHWTFYYNANYTVVLALVVNGVPPGAKVVVSCTGRGCPFATRTLPPPHPGTVDLSSWLRMSHLRAGTRLTISTVTAGAIGKRFSFTIRAAKPPLFRVGDLRPSSAKTTATIFQAFTFTGAPTIHTGTKPGHCYTGSLTIDRNDAWRCFVGNTIYDPCFSSSRAHGVVICPNPQLKGGVEIRLTSGLPHAFANTRMQSLKDQPWDIQLTSGRYCSFSSGASEVVRGKRLNYFCGPGTKYGLWGFPRRSSEPWTIFIGPLTATSLHDRRAIRHVWM
jgi:hypothetical protein